MALGAKGPRYFVLRLYLLPLLLLLLTVGSVTLLFGVKSLPSLVSRYPALFNESFLSRVAEDRERIREYLQEHRPVEYVDTVNSIAVGVLLASLTIFVAVNLPFRRYFSMLRRGQTPSTALYHYCRRFLIRTPYINGALFLAPFLILFTAIWVLELRFAGELPFDPSVELPLERYRNLRYLLLISALLSALFITVWQRHRVRMFYVTRLFGLEELRSRGVQAERDSIQGRLWLSSLTTTLLPFATVAMYVMLSFSVVQEFSELPRTKQEFLLGDYSDLVEQLGAEEEFYGWFRNVDREKLPPVLYINVVDSLQMLAGVASGLMVAFIYLFFFVRWTTADFVGPVRELRAQMERAKNGNFQAYTRVRSGDELGELGEGFNEMLYGLQERERIKGLFGQYLSPEVSREILEGTVDPEGELFHATVLFADIRDFTTRAEEMEPRDVVRLLNTYLARMIEVITEHGGTIDKFLGDGLLAVFGVPSGKDDHADEGAGAALAMHRALEPLNRELVRDGFPPITIGVGMHSGTVIAGNIGSEKKLEYTIIGDTVNLASRIEGLNKRFDSKVIASSATFEQLSEELKAACSWRRIPAVGVRGRREPVDLYAVSQTE